MCLPVSRVRRTAVLRVVMRTPTTTMTISEVCNSCTQSNKKQRNDQEQACIIMRSELPSNEHEIFKVRFFT